MEVVVTGGGPTDGGPTDGGPTDGGPTDGGPTDGGPTDGGPTDGGPTGADPAGVVGTFGVVDAIGVGTPTELVGSTGPMAGLVPVFCEFVVAIAVVMAFGVVDLTGAVVTPVVVSTTVEPSEFVVVTWETKVAGSLDETNE